MQNTQINADSAPATNVDAGATEGNIGRMGNFNAGVNGSKTSLTPPPVTKTDITSNIKQKREIYGMGSISS